AMNKLKKLLKDKVQPEILAKVISTYQFHAKRMGEITLEKKAQEKTIQDYMESVYIEATEKLHHGVELIIGGFHERSRREYGPSRMTYKERKIHITPL
ncbi:MAG: FapA family protein, partial [Colwellia sp.]